MHPKVPGLDAGAFEQVVYQRLQTQNAEVQRGQQFLQLGSAEVRGLVQKQLDRRSQRGQGSAKLVGHVGQKVAQETVDGLFLADIPKDQRHPGRSSLRWEEPGARDGQDGLAPVTQLHRDFFAASGRGHELAEGSICFEGLEDPITTLPHHLITPPAGDPLGAVAEEGDVPLAIQGHDALDNGLQQVVGPGLFPAQLGQRSLQVFAGAFESLGHERHFSDAGLDGQGAVQIALAHDVGCLGQVGQRPADPPGQEYAQQERPPPPRPGCCRPGSRSGVAAWRPSPLHPAPPRLAGRPQPVAGRWRSTDGRPRKTCSVAAPAESGTRASAAEPSSWSPPAVHPPTAYVPARFGRASAWRTHRPGPRPRTTVPSESPASPSRGCAASSQTRGRDSAGAM